MHVRQADGVGDAGRATRIVLGPYLVLLAAQAELRALRGEQGAEEEQAPAWSAQEGALGGGAPGAWPRMATQRPSAVMISYSYQYHTTTRIVTLVSLRPGGQNVQND